MAISVNNKALSDFHVHTTESDGTYEPRAVLEAAHKKGILKYMSFTDHHTTTAFDKVEAIKNWFGIEVLPGVEISTSDFKGLHILGIGMTQRDYMDKKLFDIAHDNERRLLEIFTNLKAMGINLGNEFMLGMIKESNVSRKKIAAELVNQHHAKTVKKAYAKFVGPFGAASAPTVKPSARESIELIRQSGGVPIIAHPGSVRRRGDGIPKERDDRLKADEWERLMEQLVNDGIKGVECISVSGEHKRKSDFFKSMAKNHGLLRIGGSDFHGSREGESIGNPNVKQIHIDRLLSAVQDANAEIEK